LIICLTTLRPVSLPKECGGKVNYERRQKEQNETGTDTRITVGTVNPMMKCVPGEAMSGRAEEARPSKTVFGSIALNLRAGSEPSCSGVLL
jgi:hypothetical protein